MVVFPNAKINIGLRVVSKRPDNYHNLSSCFYPLPFCDILEVLPSDELSFKSSGLPIPGTKEGNLCLKAYALLKADYDLPPVHIHLHKVIPIGAGLGGGSADGAFILKVLNEIFLLNLDMEDLASYAGRLGSDCPFFIGNKPVLVSGTGNQFAPCEVDISGKYLVLLNPGIHIATAEAYATIVPHEPEQPLAESLIKPLTTWKGEVVNDFEASMAQKYPLIAHFKDMLYQQGALYASMTGSGSSVYGIFDTAIDIKNIKGVIWAGQLP